MKYKTTLILASLFLSACTMEGSLSESSKNKNVKCTDTRDGEVFTYNTNTATNVRIGTSGGSLDVVDSNGVSRHLSSPMELYLKCVVVN